jgi:hypothetical protein
MPSRCDSLNKMGNLNLNYFQSATAISFDKIDLINLFSLGYMFGHKWPDDGIYAETCSLMKIN